MTASIATFLRDNLITELNTLESGLGTSFLIKLEDEQEKAKGNAQDWVELRVDGPYYSPQPGEYGLLVEINLLLCTLRNDQNIYRHRNIRGCFENVCSRSICIYKYGDGDSLLGTMRLGRVVASYLGEVAESIVQSVVEVHGQIELETS